MKKQIFLAILTALLLLVFGCKNDGDGLSTPMGLLPYTPQGGPELSDLYILNDFTGETEFNGFWYGWRARVVIDDVLYEFPIENYKSEGEEESGGAEEEEEEAVKWYCKAMVRMDNEEIAENHWPYPEEEYDNSENYLGFNNKSAGFHHLEYFVPGFVVEEEYANLLPGHNEIIHTPRAPAKIYPSYFPWISGLIYDVDAESKLVSTRRFMNFPIKVYLGDYVNLGLATNPEDSSETVIVSYSDMDNPAAYLDAREIDIPYTELLNNLHEEAKWAMNEWSLACDRISFVLINEPELADLSFYWSDDLPGELGVTYYRDPAYSYYSYKPAVFIGFVNKYEGSGLLHEVFRRRVVLHELGHALGIYGHSPFEGDIMYQYEPRLTQSYYMPEPELTQGDINTINTLYTIAPVYSNLPSNEYISPPEEEDFYDDFIF